MRINLDESITRLKAGDVVAIPTETVYGLAADARNENALKKIFATKERPASNPLIVHIASADKVTDWASEYSALAQILAKAFWPGPLTLVLPAKEHVSNILRANEPTVALRVPAHPITQQLLQQGQLAVAAPSANKYTQLSPTTPEHVEQSLGEGVAVLDGGACQVGIESTIISVADNTWQLLRHGMITPAAIEEICGIAASDETKEKPKAPGQHLLHYSPRTATYLFDDIQTLNAFAESHQHCHALLFNQAQAATCDYTALPADADKAATALYQTLHDMDASEAEHLLILSPPNTPAWLAIIDRIQRAAHRT